MLCKSVILFCIVERFIVIGRAILDAPHRKVSTIVFLSSIVEVLPLFTSISITQGINLFYPTWINKYVIKIHEVQSRAMVLIDVISWLEQLSQKMVSRWKIHMVLGANQDRKKTLDFHISLGGCNMEVGTISVIWLIATFGSLFRGCRRQGEPAHFWRCFYRLTIFLIPKKAGMAENLEAFNRFFLPHAH